MVRQKDHDDSFFMSLRPLFVVGQVAGLLPLSGTSSSDSNNQRKLKFSWLNLQILYSATVLCTALFFNYVSTLENLQDGIRLDQFGSTVFYTVCNLNTIFFFNFAKILPELTIRFAAIERKMVEYGHPVGVGRQIKIFLGVFLVLSTFEHSLLVYQNVLGSIAESGRENISFLKAFFSFRFTTIMRSVIYSDAMVIYVFVINLICTLNWNYLDFFLASISIVLYRKLSLINERLQIVSEKDRTEEFWRKIRDDYNSLALLTKEIGDKVSGLVLMSYASNLYHLSLQLLRSLKFVGDQYSMVYFYFSLCYLIMRTVAVTLCAAKIEKASKAPKEILYTMQSSSFEASRLLDQVVNDDIHLTGKKFFVVNHHFCVVLVGTIVTYEVILLQLNSLRYEHSRFY